MAVRYQSADLRKQAPNSPERQLHRPSTQAEAASRSMPTAWTSMRMEGIRVGFRNNRHGGE